MNINGIEQLVYGVDDVEQSTRFFDDFGLPLEYSSKTESRFVLAEGSSVVIRPIEAARVAGSAIEGIGVQEAIFGVTTAARLEALASGLAKDRELRRDADGTVHFIADGGIPMGLRVFAKAPVTSAPDPVNSPGRIHRINTHRRWRKRAVPKTIAHVVFAVNDFEAAFRFMRERLCFRITDYQPTYGIYARCDGTVSHHNLFLLNASAKLPGFDGKARFHHANFGVDDIDEIMIGANNMQRKGWAKSHLGLGRHRIDSALFLYLPCPAGGEAEYGADGDCVDDSWVPRYWTSPNFGYLQFAHDMPPFFHQEPSWEVRYLDEEKDFTTKAAPR